MQTMDAVCIGSVKHKRRAAKETTIQSHSNLGLSNLFDLLPKITTLKGLKVWTQHRSKGQPLNKTNGHLDVDYLYKS